MVYNFIKSVLDSKGYNSSQDTPLGELLDTAEQHFVYTADGGNLRYEYGQSGY